MSTVTWVLIGVCAYAALLVLTLSWMSAAKRGDEAMRMGLGEEPRWRAASHSPPPASQPSLEASSELTGRLAVDVQHALRVERVAVVLHPAGDPGSGVVEACCGVADLLGRPAVPLPGGSVTDSAWELLADRTLGRPWRVTAVPMSGEHGAVGWVAVGTRRGRPFGTRDTEFLERLAHQAARRLESTAGPRSALRRSSR